MNYPESKLILDEIKKAKKILLNCHRGPDSDSVGSAMAIRKALLNMSKEIDVICPSDIPGDLLFIKDSKKIKKVEFKNFDFSKYDLFIVSDSSTYGMATGDNNIQLPDINLIVIDHHYTNKKYGSINIVDPKTTSTAEVLFKVFSDWDIKIDVEIATNLLTGILGDTGCFQFNGVGKDSFDIAGKLIDAGAEKEKIVLNIYRSVDFNTVKFWGKIIENLKLDEESHFVWSAISNSVYVDFGEDVSAKEDASNLFAPVVNGTDFGLVIVESDKNVLSVSFRSRDNFDVSKIAQELGGGGHIAAAGAKVEGSFDDAVEKVLTACRKYAKKN